jgi:hypothetical protein
MGFLVVVASVLMGLLIVITPILMSLLIKVASVFVGLLVIVAPVFVGLLVVVTSVFVGPLVVVTSIFMGFLVIVAPVLVGSLVGVASVFMGIVRATDGHVQLCLSTATMWYLIVPLIARAQGSSDGDHCRLNRKDVCTKAGEAEKSDDELHRCNLVRIRCFGCKRQRSRLWMRRC